MSSEAEAGSGVPPAVFKRVVRSFFRWEEKEGEMQ